MINNKLNMNLDEKMMLYFNILGAWEINLDTDWLSELLTAKAIFYVSTWDLLVANNEMKKIYGSEKMKELEVLNRGAKMHLNVISRKDVLHDMKTAFETFILNS